MNNKPKLSHCTTYVENNAVYICAEFNKNKGDGKMWIANIPYEGAKYDFLKTTTFLAKNNFSGWKTFKLNDGVYLYHNFESDDSNCRKYITVKNCEIFDDQCWDLIK